MAASATLTRRAYHRHTPLESPHWSALERTSTSASTLSLDQLTDQSAASHHRFRQLCTKLKRRFDSSRESFARNEELLTSQLVTRWMILFRDYKSLPSSPLNDETRQEFEWPDFERIYNSLSPCLVNAVPSLDDFSLCGSDDDDRQLLVNSVDSVLIEQDLTEQTNELRSCQRGRAFRRNAICQKLDKRQHDGQLHTFIQQLMIEKLMHVWT